MASIEWAVGTEVGYFTANLHPPTTAWMETVNSSASFAYQGRICMQHVSVLDIYFCLFWFFFFNPYFTRKSVYIFGITLHIICVSCTTACDLGRLYLRVSIAARQYSRSPSSERDLTACCFRLNSVYIAACSSKKRVCISLNSICHFVSKVVWLFGSSSWATAHYQWLRLWCTRQTDTMWCSRDRGWKLMGFLVFIKDFSGAASQSHSYKNIWIWWAIHIISLKEKLP